VGSRPGRLRFGAGQHRLTRASTCVTSCTTPARPLLVVQRSLTHRVAAIAAELPELRHVIVVDDGDDGDDAHTDPGDDDVTGRGVTTLEHRDNLSVHAWTDILTSEAKVPDVTIRPSDIGTFVYTGGTTGPSKGCMLSHNYHEAASRQIGICWERTAEDVLWTPLPLFHYNALVNRCASVHSSSAAVRRSTDGSPSPTSGPR